MTTSLNPTDFWDSNRDCINKYIHQHMDASEYVDAWAHICAGERAGTMVSVLSERECIS